MAAVDLATPAIADFDFAITRRGAITNDEMVGKTVRHPSHIAVVVIENASVPLTSAAVMHDNKAPAFAQDRSAIDFATDRTGHVVVMFSEEMERQRKSARLLVTGFFYNDLRRLRGSDRRSGLSGRG